ncbi:MAG: cell division topological specificity factor MinE [Bacillota bacterium]
MGFLDGLFGRRKPSKQIAKERLQLVLSHDRMRIPAGILEPLKDDLIRVISNYIEIDESGITVEFGNYDGQRRSLVASIPVIGMRRDRVR